MVAKADATVRYRGASHALACNEFSDGTMAPRGYQRLAGFHLEGTIPVWTYAIGDALLEQRVWMAHGHNTTHVQYSLLQAGAPPARHAPPPWTHPGHHPPPPGRPPVPVDPAQSARP